jgi:hypothetical protein
VVGCLRVRGRAALSARGGQSARGRGRSTRSQLTECSSCSSRVLARLCFDPFRWVFLVGKCLSDGPPRVAGPSVRRGRSASVWWMVRY